MSRQAVRITVVGVTILALLAIPALADVTSIAGFTQVEVTEYYNGVARDSERVSETYPDTATELPLQVVARLVASGALGSNLTEDAAAAVAAQFADPLELTSPNPEEFAINLALNSLSDHIYYQARAITRETRNIRYEPADLGLFVAEGVSVTQTGRLYLDGALTLFAADASADLSNTFALLRVTVVKRVAGHNDVTTFTGEIELRGTTDGGATVLAEGAFPTTQLILSDLALLSADFAAFHVLIIPNIRIDYTYPAVAGEDFTLEATVDVLAANDTGRVGSAVVLGTPTDTLTQVIGLTQGDEVASNTLTALEKERENPSGSAAVARPIILPWCGLLGFESVFGVAFLTLYCSGMFGRMRGRPSA